MIKIILIVAFTIGFAATASAQNRSIAFQQTRSWEKIVETAKAQDKLIFIDCYTEWCGPCKALAKNVFTRDEVADFFNENFVNVKFDMEKDKDGMARIDQWEVKAFPTLLFIDPATEAPVHKLVGAGDADWLLRAGQAAADPKGNLAAMIERYNSGRRGPVFVDTFIGALKDANMESRIEQVVDDYFSSLSVEEMATPGNWKLIEKYATDPLTAPLLTVKQNREMFYDIPGENQQNAVDMKLGNAVLQTAVEYVSNPNLMIWEQDRFNAFVDFLETVDSPVKEMAAVWLNTSMLVQKKDWNNLLETMKIVEKEQLLPGDQMAQYISFFAQSIGKDGTKASVDAAIVWLDELIEKYSGDTLAALSSQAAIANAKLQLCNAAGRSGLAQKTHKILETYMEQIKSLSASQRQR